MGLDGFGGSQNYGHRDIITIMEKQMENEIETGII